MNNSKHLGERSIKKLLLEFCIPSILGLTVTAIFNILYRLLVLRGIGERALSAFSICFPLMFIITAFGGLVSAGSSSMISTRLGKGKKERSEIIMCNAITLVLIISISIVIFSIVNINFILDVISPSYSLRNYSESYLGLLLIGSIFQNMGSTLCGFIRAEGSPGYAMLITIISVISNVILAYILIIIFHFGILILGVAMLSSEIFSLLWALYYFFGGKSYIKMRLKYFRLQSRVVKNIILIGFPSFIAGILGSLIAIVINRELTLYSGNTAIAAASIISSISVIFFMPVIGINHGIQPLIGYNYSSRNYIRVKKIIVFVIIISTLLMTLGFILCTNYAKEIISLFSKNKSNLTDITLRGLKISILAMPVFGIQIMANNYFQAVGKYKHALILTIIKNVTYLIPLVLLPKWIGITGVWVSNPLGDIIYALIGALFIGFEISNMGRKKYSK